MAEHGKLLRSHSDGTKVTSDGSVPLIFQEFFDFQRCHASRARRRDRLTIAPVLDVSAGVYTGNFGEDEIRSFQVSVLVHV